MMTALKLVPALSLLMAGASFGQGTTSATPQTKQAKPKSSGSKQMVMDPKMHEQMMADAKKMETQIQELKKAVADERAKSIDPAHHSEMMAQQKASDQQIEALQATAKILRQQLDAAPHYIDQKGGPTTGP